MYLSVLGLTKLNQAMQLIGLKSELARIEDESDQTISSN